MESRQELRAGTCIGGCCGDGGEPLSLLLLAELPSPPAMVGAAGGIGVRLVGLYFLTRFLDCLAGRLEVFAGVLLGASPGVTAAREGPQQHQRQKHVQIGSNFHSSPFLLAEARVGVTQLPVTLH